MKVLVIGLGSIGKRHIRILKSIQDVEIIALRSKEGTLNDEFEKHNKIKSMFSMAEVLNAKPDFAIISNPTSMHIKPALILAEKKIPFLLEKPVSHNLKYLSTLSNIINKNKIPVLVGFQMRHHPCYKKMIEWLKEIGTPLHCHGYVGQYLPDWRPGIDYRTNYSAIASMGGGVILDLCHQIDISLSIMGNPHLCSCLNDRCSDLEIETEDNADILLSHNNGKTSHIHMNYLERTYVWYTRITGTEGTIIWDYGKGKISLLKKDQEPQEWHVPEEFERDTLFRDQMRHWLAVIKGEEKPVTGIDDGIMVTKIAVAAKKSTLKKRHIAI